MVTKADLQAFQQFAVQRVSTGDVNSLTDLAGEWEAQKREIEATVQDIKQSHAEIESGDVSSVADAFTNARHKLGQG